MRLNREPAFPKCCDFWVSQGRQLLLGVVTNWTLKVFQPLWETLLTGHAVLEQEERSLKPLGVFPGLPLQEQIPFFPWEICSPSTQPLGKKEAESHLGLCHCSTVAPQQAGMNPQEEGAHSLSALESCRMQILGGFSPCVRCCRP